MGKKQKLFDGQSPIPITDEAAPELLSHKKKKKQQVEASASPEQPENHVSVDTQQVKEKKKKKKKKNKEEEEIIDGSNAEEVANGIENKGVENGIKNKDKKEKKKEQKQSKDSEVSVSGKGSEDAKYRTLQSFEEAGLPENVLQCCKNFKKPSPIQAHAWPFLLDGRDFIGIAATGSGKTIAFGVPALIHILRKENRQTMKKSLPYCLVLSPTRELAQQIADVLADAGDSCGVKSVCLYGGTSKGHQISVMKSGVDIVVATPGRLKDLMDSGFCNLSEASFVVLDEADRMLDLGFEPEVRAILSQTSSSRQTVMFSATWPVAVHQLAKEFMDPNPIKVVVGSQDLAANHDVMQIVEVLEDRTRDMRLVSLLEKYHQSRRNRVLVFVLYKKEAVRVESMLQRRGWNVVAVHGDKSQHDRTKAVTLFKDGKCPLLIATDVAARGLDIPDVEVVINYSFPLTTEDYVHRIGRTGRAGKKGVAHTFFTQADKARSGELVNVLREAGQVVPDDLLKFGTHVKKKESKLYGAHFKEITANAPKSTKITFADSDDE
jgi:ATP-dependent RNA helicase DBP3